MSARGLCVGCKREYAVNGDGTTRKHKTKDGKEVCPGSGQKPATVAKPSTGKGKGKGKEKGSGAAAAKGGRVAAPSKKKGGSMFSGHNHHDWRGQ